MGACLMEQFFRFFSLGILGFSLPAANASAVIEVGDDVPEYCWTDVSQKKICHPAFVGNVRVLIYSTGWCPDCNKEMAVLAVRSQEFADKPVTFISLSAQGDVQGAPPTIDFLKGWRERHKIPFLVAASPRDAGKNFFAPPIYIPNVVVIGRDNRLAYKSIGPTVDELFAEIKKALGDSYDPSGH